MIDQTEHDLSLCLWLVKCSGGTLQPYQRNPSIALKRMALIIVCVLLDAALIPLIEDLFKELAMIEACNKVRNEEYGKRDTILTAKESTKLACAATSTGAPIASVDGASLPLSPKRPTLPIYPPLVRFPASFAIFPLATCTYFADLCYAIFCLG